MGIKKYQELDMNDEYELINSKIPDLQTTLANRIATKSQTTTPTTPPPGTFDPYKAMLKKKEAESAPVDPSIIQTWPDEDVKRLEDFCKKMGIFGFSAGRMSPIAALALLKQKLGVVDGIPEGAVSNPNFPYEQMIKKKQLLYG
jgi:hypothetical protein